MANFLAVQMLMASLLWICRHVIFLTGGFLLIAQQRISNCVFLHNVNRYWSILIGRSVIWKNYANIMVVLERWNIATTNPPVVDLCGFENGEFPIGKQATAFPF